MRWTVIPELSNYLALPSTDIAVDIVVDLLILA